MRVEIGIMEQYRLQQIWKLSWPVVLEMLSVMMGGFFLTMMTGTFGPSPQAAVGLSTTMTIATSFIMSAAGTGTGVLVAQALGAKDMERVRVLAGQALLIGFVGGFLLLLGGTGLASSIVTISGLTGEVAEMTRSCLQISFTFIPFLVIMQICLAVLRALGKTKLSFFVSASNNAIMVVVAGYLLFVAKAGVIGAVFGASAGQIYGAALGVFLLTRRSSAGVRLQDIYRVRKDLIAKIMNLSIPAGLEQFALQGGRIFYTLILATLGAVQMAAHQITLQVEGLSFLPGMAFSIAALTLVGQNIGRGLPHRAKQYATRCVQVAVIGMSLVGVVFLLMARPLGELFTSDPSVLEWTTFCIMMAAAEQPTLAATMVISGALRGTGDTRWPMILTFLGVWGIRIPLMLFLLSIGKLTVGWTWVITAFEFAVRGALMYWRFKKIDWERFYKRTTPPALERRQ